CRQLGRFDNRGVRLSTLWAGDRTRLWQIVLPACDPLVGTLQTFGIYAVGFASRPIGAAIFAHYGDRIGRKAALIGTLLLTGLATFAVGSVPSYDQIGIWGAVILTMLRFVQGVGVGANGPLR